MMGHNTRRGYAPLDIGTTFQYALSLYRKYAADILTYSFVTVGTHILFLLIWELHPEYSRFWFVSLMRIILLRLVPFIATAALMLYIHDHEHRHNTSLRTMIKRLNRTLVPLLLSVLLVTTVSVVGLLVFIIPGVLFIIMFSQTYFFTLYEGHLNPFRALSASEHLTRHNRFRILCIFALFSACYLITYAFMKAVVPPYVLAIADTVVSCFMIILNYSIWRGLKREI